MLFVASAGNDGVDVTQDNVTPASFDEDHFSLLTVGGVEGLACSGGLASFSNWGTSVDIAAPSENLRVPGLGGDWSADAYGTSFAAPIVVAAAVQSWLCYLESPAGGTLSGPLGGAAHPVKEQLLNTLTAVPALQSYNIDGVVTFGGACSGIQQQLAQQSDNEVWSQQDLQQEEVGSQLQVYPNPFVDRIQLVVPAEEMILSWSVSTSAGQVMFHTAEAAPISKADLGQLIPGTYWLSITTDQNTYTRLVVKN